jgi:hypothetical protein
MLGCLLLAVVKDTLIIMIVLGCVYLLQFALRYNILLRCPVLKHINAVGRNVKARSPSNVSPMFRLSPLSVPLHGHYNVALCTLFRLYDFCFKY